MDQSVLLAKRVKDPNKEPLFEETLWGHTFKVMESFETMFGSPTFGLTKLAEMLMEFMGLSASQTETFLVNGYGSALC